MSVPASTASVPGREITRAVALRRRLHQQPEIGHQEHHTVAVLERELAAFRLERPGNTGLIARVGPSRGPQVLLRAELDGLPITERTEVAWRSTNGAMHACGHDVHMAALVAACRILAQRPLEVGAMAVFQPSEERYPSGARHLLDSGVFDGLDIGAALALHVHPDVEYGTVAVTPGPVNAAADELVITVHGSSGHAAYPHQTSDPVATICQIVVALQQVVARRTDPVRPTVLSICRLQAGDAANAVPETATATGTLRCLFEEDRQALREAVTEVAAGVAVVGRCTAKVEFVEGEPALVNDPSLTQHVAARLSGTGLARAAVMRSCGSDDFAYFRQLGPTLMGFVGLQGHPGFEPQPLHHPRFLAPDVVVGDVVRALLAGYEGAVSMLHGGARQKEGVR